MRSKTLWYSGRTVAYVAGCVLGFTAAGCEGAQDSSFDPVVASPADGPKYQPADETPISTTPTEGTPGSEQEAVDPEATPTESTTPTPTDSPTPTEVEGEESALPPSPGESLSDPTATAPDPEEEQTPSGSHGIPAPTGTLPGDGSAAPLFGGWMAATPQQPWTVQDLGVYPTELPPGPAAIAPEAVHPAWTTGRRLAVHATSLFVCVPEAGTLVELARDTGKVVRSISIGGRPEQVVVAPDGTAYVTLRQAGAIARIAPGAATVSAIVPVGTEPFGLALSIEATQLYVTTSGDDAVVMLSVPGLEIQGTLAAGFRPRSIAVGLDGELFVSGERGTATVLGAAEAATQIPLRVLNPGDLTIHSKLEPKIPGIANRAFGIGVHPVTGSAYFPHHIVRSGTPESESKKLDPTPPTGNVCTPPTFCPNPGGYGSASCNPVCEKVNLVFPRTRRPIEWSVTTLGKASNSSNATTAALPIRHGATGEPMTAICDKPIDAIHHATLSLLFVVCEGTDNVLVLNTSVADPMTAIVGEIRVGAAPRAIALSEDGSTAYVANAQAFSVGRIDVTAFVASLVKTNRPGATSDAFFPPTFAAGTTVAPSTTAMVEEAVYATDPIDDEAERLGRRAYTFARFEGLSANGFFACATCHVEGADDGLTWFVVDGPRQTPMLAQRLAGTAPFNWIGTAPTLPENIHNTVTRMGGTGISLEVAQGISSYLLGDDGPVAAPNKYLAPSGLTQEQKAGQALFFNPVVGCATCHSGSVLTDGKTWDVGTFSPLELELRILNASTAPLALNTPSLRGLYNSPPYAHDGSIPTLEGVLTSTATTMGHSFMLTKVQQQQLVAYLLTL